MTSEPVDAGQETEQSSDEAIKADITHLVFEIKRERRHEDFEYQPSSEDGNPGSRAWDSLIASVAGVAGVIGCVTGAVGQIFSPEVVALATATAIFSKAFLETLGSRAGDGVANLPRHVGDLVRTWHRRRSGGEEYRIQLDGSTAAIAVTKATPDEARLALLDLDVTAEELRGKLLRWDTAASAWLPEAVEAESKAAGD
jgi:hypothetical protein